MTGLEIRKCGCCGKDEGQITRRTKWGYVEHRESDLTARARGFELCPPCLAGYEGGTFVAVGIQHELRGIKRHKPLGEHKPLTLAATMKAHAKGAALQAAIKAEREELLAAVAA